MSELNGTIAIVTGASSGIGTATAVELARLGAEVGLVARRRDRLEEIAARIEASSGRAFVVDADLTVEGAAEKVVETVLARCGRFDIVVANAALMKLGPVEGAPAQEWREMVETNIFGLMHIARAALPHLLIAASSEPRYVADLVLVSSIGARFAWSGSAVYGATKAAVNSFGESLRQEVTRRHVRVSLVEPGATSTELTTHSRTEVMANLSSAMQDVQRLAPADIADAIAYVVTRPRHVVVNEILVRPTEQLS